MLSYKKLHVKYCVALALLVCFFLHDLELQTDQQGCHLPSTQRQAAEQLWGIIASMLKEKVSVGDDNTKMDTNDEQDEDEEDDDKYGDEIEHNIEAGGRAFKTYYMKWAFKMKIFLSDLTSTMVSPKTKRAIQSSLNPEVVLPAHKSCSCKGLLPKAFLPIGQ